MAQVLFDKMVYVDTLKNAGVAEGQARAQAHALDLALHESVATKGDMSALRGDVEGIETALRIDITALGKDIDAKLSLLREETKGKTDILSAQFTMHQRIVLGVGVGVLLLVIKAFL